MTNSISFRNDINEILQILQASLMTLSFKLEDIVNSILFAKSNTLQPSVITPKQLYIELSNNIRHVSRNKELVISLDLNNIHVILNLSSTLCYSLDNKIIFIVKIPLVNLNDYNLYKVLPVPTPHKVENPNSYSLITPTKQYIALNRDKSTYFMLDSLEPCNF